MKASYRSRFKLKMISRQISFAVRKFFYYVYYVFILQNYYRGEFERHSWLINKGQAHL
jgi:hypothetical protein